MTPVPATSENALQSGGSLLIASDYLPLTYLIPSTLHFVYLYSRVSLPRVFLFLLLAAVTKHVLPP